MASVSVAPVAVMIHLESQEIEHWRRMREVAQLVVRDPADADWLDKVFSYFLWDVRCAHSSNQVQPTKTEMWDLLVKAETLAVELSNVLAGPWPAEYLTANTETCSDEFFKAGAYFHSVLISAARQTRKSPKLIAPNGDVRPGRGKATLPQWISPQQTCAAIVEEIWAHFHEGQYPKVHSRPAWAVAQAYWEAATGVMGQPGSDPFSKWSNYFGTAGTPEQDVLRKKVRLVLNSKETQHAYRNESELTRTK
jgi:hypothetical protein